MIKGKGFQTHLTCPRMNNRLCHRKENAASGMDMDFLDDEDDEDLSSDKEEVRQVHKRGKMIQKLM